VLTPYKEYIKCQNSPEIGGGRLFAVGPLTSVRVAMVDVILDLLALLQPFLCNLPGFAVHGPSPPLTLNARTS